MRREDVINNTRLAGLVDRYHAWPTLTRQTVAEHTWQLMRIYSEMFGNPTSDVFQYILWHDAAELMTGDIPFPMKAHNPALKTALDALEDAWLSTNTAGVPSITLEEKGCVKICDLVEMWEFGSYEMQLGNAYAKPIVEDTLKAARDIACGLGADVNKQFLQYIEVKKQWQL